MMNFPTAFCLLGEIEVQMEAVTDETLRMCGTVSRSLSRMVPGLSSTVRYDIHVSSVRSTLSRISYNFPLKTLKLWSNLSCRGVILYNVPAQNN
jgi:hypothetical protein